jgi:hypothetical protein
MSSCVLILFSCERTSGFFNLKFLISDSFDDSCDDFCSALIEDSETREVLSKAPVASGIEMPTEKSRFSWSFSGAELVKPRNPCWGCWCPLEILKGSLLLKAQMCTGGRQGTGASVNDSEAPLVIGVDPLVV